MSTHEIIALLPFIIVATASVVVMIAIAFRRSHRLTVILTLAGLGAAVASLPAVSMRAPLAVTRLIIMDAYALYFLGLLFLAGIAVAVLSYSYLEMQIGDREEFYILLLLATLGAGILAASTHFASFFLGIEILSVSLYALAAYQRHNDRSIEAGVKYLILAAVSSAFILFGMALIYAETGSLEFGEIASRSVSSGMRALPFSTGLLLLVVGLGFKLAVVPFHLWTPDVYEGAPAPVTAFIATVSKGGVFALVMRFFLHIDLNSQHALFVIFSIVAVASMFSGNLLALLQTNVKRILAYSSIAHLGYLLVALLAGGPLRLSAAAFYLAAYFVTTLGAFGVVTVLSVRNSDADNLEEYRGLAWRNPWLAAVFTAMLLSLAGIPLTAGFIGKFYLVAAGLGSGLWLLVAVLVVNSAIGLFYYLRIVQMVYADQEKEMPERRIPLSGGGVLAFLSVALVWLGVFPGPVLALIEKISRQ